ncbi:hypothetical protein PROFUN_03598 [Planoprotostelium fungivorum]|uniref:Uncharacterized protein n=1 Tax=Planoprotostelium fungivorum TaxID=1890364 RepID=A0A2P6MSL0_9EUKA|nr:hypothetical protein PROFUN_03598 [Planoprotostelium fungivorum]
MATVKSRQSSALQSTPFMSERSSSFDGTDPSVDNDDGNTYHEEGYYDHDGVWHGYEFDEHNEAIDEDESSLVYGQQIEETVPEVEDSSISHRTKIAREILSTERSYVGALEFTMKYFLKPLTELSETDKRILKPKTIDLIFSNLDQIYNANAPLLSALESKLSNWSDDTSTIGDMFLEQVPEFVAYKHYLERHDLTIRKLRKLDKKSSWQAFQQEMKEQPGSLKGDLSFYLIQPVQRMPRYELLLKDLIKHTNENHPDYKNLKDALQSINELVISANEEMRKQAELEKLYKIQNKFTDLPSSVTIAVPDRKKVKDGMLVKVCRKELKRRYFCLFNDSLIYGAPTNMGHYKYSRFLSFVNGKIRIKLIEDTENQRNAFQILSAEKSFTVCAETPEERSAWNKAFQSVFTGALDGGSEIMSEGSAYSQSLDASEAPVWIPDSKYKMCMICGSKFNLVNRRHHCRACGKIICNACSRERMQLNTNKKSRVCKICIDLVQIIKEGDVSNASYGGSSIFGSSASFSSTDQMTPTSPGSPEGDRRKPPVGFSYFGGNSMKEMTFESRNSGDISTNPNGVDQNSQASPRVQKELSTSERDLVAMIKKKYSVIKDRRGKPEENSPAPPPPPPPTVLSTSTYTSQVTPPMAVNRGPPGIALVGIGHKLPPSGQVFSPPNPTNTNSSTSSGNPSSLPNSNCIPPRPALPPRPHAQTAPSQPQVLPNTSPSPPLVRQTSHTESDMVRGEARSLPPVPANNNRVRAPMGARPPVPVKPAQRQ